jgi:hypothetical protein
LTLQGMVALCDCVMSRDIADTYVAVHRGH